MSVEESGPDSEGSSQWESIADSQASSLFHPRNPKKPSKVGVKTRKKKLRKFNYALNPTAFIGDKLRRKLRDRNKTPINVSQQVIQHIYEAHGNFQNASRQKRIRGKMPSYFRSGRVMTKSIIRTVGDPNWIRPAKGYGAGRLFHFKKFKSELGKSGEGYSCCREGDNKECYACAVLLDPKRGLVTAFPMLTTDAFEYGVGVKTEIKEDTTSTSLSTPSDEEKSGEKEEEEQTDDNSDTTIKAA